MLESVSKALKRYVYILSSKSQTFWMLQVENLDLSTLKQHWNKNILLDEITTAFIPSWLNFFVIHFESK